LLLSVFLALGIVHSALFLEEVSLKLKFEQYLNDFRKIYSADEYSLRMNNFKASLQRVEDLNKKSKNKVFGITKYSDMSTEEFRSTMLMKKGINKEQEARPNIPVLSPKKNSDRQPAAFDWRDYGAVTAVKDQGQCGSCWAFSVVENIESMYIVAKKATNTTIDLAPQQLVDCDDSDDGCNGGDPPTAYDYIMSAGGLESEKVYPYTAVNGNCQFNPKAQLWPISTWNYATSLYSETTLQSNLLSWGPLSICLDAENWQDYTSGVMTWTECAWVNVLDHCVQLVGYNSTAPTPYWIVRNSWNTDWGINGYIYLEMWEDTCGLAHEATCAVL